MPANLLLTIILATLSAIIATVAALVIWRWLWIRSGRQRRVEPTKLEIIDTELGRCEVVLPVPGQTLGSVRCWASVEQNKCEFADYFSEGQENKVLVQKSLERLRTFFRIAGDPQLLKICKNSLYEAMPFHVALYPKTPLSEESLKVGARLVYVAVRSNGVADFKFHHPVFMEGGTITMHVASNGTVSLVGVP